jgi:hypothetical protein
MSSFPLPSVTPPTLSSYQMSFNGLTFGAGTAYAITGVAGLDLPAVRTADVARPRSTGEFIGIDLLGGRDIILSMDAVSDGTSLQHALQALAAAFNPPVGGQTESQLWIQLPNLPLFSVGCRVRKRQIPIDLAWTQGLAKTITIQLHATDPRVYGPVTGSTVTLNTPTGVAFFPMTFPFTFTPGIGSSTTVTVDNTGDIEMKPLVTITGTATGPIAISNTTTGQFIEISNPNQSPHTLNSGDTLSIDFDSHNIIYTPSGGSPSSVRSWLVVGSTWWTLPPGNSTLQFSTADSTAPSPLPTMTVDWAPAFSSAT